MHSFSYSFPCVRVQLFLPLITCVCALLFFPMLVCFLCFPSSLVCVLASVYVCVVFLPCKLVCVYSYSFPYMYVCVGVCVSPVIPSLTCVLLFLPLVVCVGVQLFLPLCVCVFCSFPYLCVCPVIPSLTCVCVSF